jgi:hypothetical protein
MAQLEVIKSLARQALTICTSTGRLNDFLWDRVQRLSCNVEYICRLPELAGTARPIDHFCLTAATYFSDAGLARHLQSQKTMVALVKPDVDTREMLDFSTEVVTEKLAGIVEESKIEKINRIITESGDHFTQSTEAMILSDARNLDDMGAVGIFNEFRQLVAASKGPSDAAQSWERKMDYRYWQARLKKSFRFEQVRKLAKQRLSAAEQFMNQLKVELEAQDLKELSVNSAFV